VNLQQQGKVTITFSVAPPGVDMAFRMLDQTGAVVRDWQTSPKDGEVFSAEVDVKKPGRYLVEVRDGYNNARSPQPYSLTVSQ